MAVTSIVLLVICIVGMLWVWRRCGIKRRYRRKSSEYAQPTMPWDWQRWLFSIGNRCRLGREMTKRWTIRHEVTWFFWTVLSKSHQINDVHELRGWMAIKHYHLIKRWTLSR
jgi:hypothetical protein